MTTTGRIGTVLAVLPAVLLACLQSAPVRAEEPIAILYNDRPPYQVTHQDGSVSGLSATPAAQAFKIAGIPVIWVRVPTNRQLSLIKHDSEKACALGWFRKPDREQYAKFTVPIYRDKPTVALSGARFTVPAGTTLAEVLARKGVRVLVKDLYSYGPYIDDLLKTLRPDVIRTTSENHQMVQMIQAGRADFMFVAEEEASYFIQQAELAQNALRLLRFSDMSEGEKRHLMCSKQVPDALIAKLNNAIGGH